VTTRSTARLQRMLGLGLGLSGATRGLIVLSDRTVLATAGDPLAREELDGALAELALSQPAAALIPDLAAWPVADRRALVAVMRSKGSGSEMAYARRLDRHRRLRRSLEILVRG